MTLQYVKIEDMKVGESDRIEAGKKLRVYRLNPYQDVWDSLEGLPSSIVNDPDNLAAYLKKQEDVARQEDVVAVCPRYETGTSIACSNCGMAHGGELEEGNS